MTHHPGLRRAVAAVAATCLGTLGTARADDPPAIPVRELPPLPDLEEDLGDVSDVSLASAQEVDDDRVVGAAKREQSLGTVASAVTVVTPDQIRRFGYRTLAEALGAVAGVFLADDRSIERVGIRGIQLVGDNNTRILVLIDGTPLNEPWAQYVDASYALPVNLDDVARIEVIRGPVSSIYGTNAFFGIVNIVTKAADVSAPAYGSVTTDSLTGLGGNAGFALGDVNRQVRGAVSFRQRDAESLAYDLDQLDQVDGAPDAVTTEADGLTSLNAALTATYNRLFVQVRGYQRARELPGAPYGAVFGSADNVNRDQQVIGELGYTQELGEQVTLAARAYASAYDFRGELAYADDGTGAAGILQTNGRSRWAGGELRGLFDLSSLMPAGGALDLTTGVAVEATRTSSDSQFAGMPVANEITRDFALQGVYGEVNAAPTRWLGVTAGVRFDNHSLLERKINPRLALVLYDRDRYGVKLLYAQGFRNPSIFEAFFEDDRFRPACAPSCETASPAQLLDAETIASYEAVVWARPARGLKLRASGWFWDLGGLIGRNGVNLDNDLRFQYQNLSGLRSRGVEVESTYRNTAGWFGYLNAAYAVVDQNVIDEAPNSPALVASGGVSTPPLLRRFHVSAEAQFLGERETRDPTVTAAAWTGVNAAIYVPDLSGFDVTIGARNLLGQRQDVVVQSDYDRPGNPDLMRFEAPSQVLIVPGAGLEVFVRVGYTL